MKKAQKPAVVEALAANFSGAKSIIVIDYSGLGVKAQQELKKRLKIVDAIMVVAKNSLVSRAGIKSKLPKEFTSDTALSGPTALVLANGDSIAPLSVLAKFAKEYEIPQFKVGIVDGSFFNKEGLNLLSNLPSKEIILSQVLGTIAQPLYQTVSILQRNIQSLFYILKSKGGDHL